jgi:hypothetical protein
LDTTALFLTNLYFSQTPSATEIRNVTGKSNNLRIREKKMKK